MQISKWCRRMFRDAFWFLWIQCNWTSSFAAGKTFLSQSIYVSLSSSSIRHQMKSVCLSLWFSYSWHHYLFPFFRGSWLTLIFLLLLSRIQGWIEEHEAFRIGTSSLNQDDRVRKGEALQRSLPLTTIRDTKENRSRYLSFTKPRNRRVTSESSSTPSTHFGASSDRLMSRSLSEKVLPAYDPVPSKKESSFAPVSERAVQVS